MEWLYTVLCDARYALRAMRRSPGFSAVAVLSLALGIGANTAIFGVVNALMLKALPVQQPERLVEVARSDGPNVYSFAIWRQIEAQQDVFSEVFAQGETVFHLGGGGEKHSVSGLYVSGQYFQTLGVSPVLGRALTPSDDQHGAAAVCVLGYGFWQRQFGGDRLVMGRSIELDGRPFEVIGVTAPEFFGVSAGNNFDVMVPLASERIIHPDHSPLDSPRRWWLSVVARLNPGINEDQATARLKILSPSIFRASIPPGDDVKNWQALMRRSLITRAMPTGLSNARYSYTEPLIVVLIMVGVVLLIACANISQLLLARVSARRREIAVRIAIGATRSRIVRQLLTESVILSLVGAVLGVSFATWGSQAIVHAISTSYWVAYLDLSFNLRMFGFVISVAMASAILFGVLPAMSAAETAPYTAMKSSSTGITHRRSAIGGMLIIGQVALSMTLLVGAGLFVRTLSALLGVDAGFDRNGVLLIKTELLATASPEQRIALSHQFLAELRRVPGVISAGRSAVPANAPVPRPTMLVETPGGATRRYRPFFVYVSPEYLQTMKTSLVAGRDFSDEDRADSPPVAILNQTAALNLVGNISPVGTSYREIGEDGKTRDTRVQIVGLARDAKYGRLSEAAFGIAYRPISQDAGVDAVPESFAVRFTAPVADVRQRVKELARAADPNLLVEFQLLSSAVNESLQRERLVAAMASLFAALTLLLAAIGIYGVLSYTTTQRSREIGIRMALGAQRHDLIRLIVGESLALVVAGVIVGAPVAFATARLARGMLYGVTAADPLTFAAAAIVILMVALLAAFLPAYRASSFDPLIPLRYE
jgi:putative ABC transport system permease protein